MLWAVVFLPSHIIELTNFSTRVELYTGSGRLLASRYVLFSASSFCVRCITAHLAGDSIFAPFGLLAPYFDRLCLRLATPAVSSAPRTT